MGSVVGDSEGVLALLQRASQAYEREKAALQAAALAAETLLRAQSTVRQGAFDGRAAEDTEETRRGNERGDEHPAFQDETIVELQGSTGDKHALRGLADRKIFAPLPSPSAPPPPTSPVQEETSQEDGDEISRKNHAAGINGALQPCEPSSDTIAMARGETAEGTPLSAASLEISPRRAEDLLLPGEAPHKSESAGGKSEEATMQPSRSEPAKPWRNAVNKIRVDQASGSAITPKSIIEKMKPSRRGNTSRGPSVRHGLEVYPVWQRMQCRARSQADLSLAETKSKPSLKRTLSNALNASADEIVRETRFQKCQKQLNKRCHPSRWTTPPTSGRVLAWNMFGMLCIAYDMVMIPLGFFDVPSSTGTIGLGLCVTCFWTFDIFFRFFVGYNKANGLVERRFCRIACRYLRTWFTLDMGLVVVDWLVFLGESGADTLGLMRLGKTLRTARSLKLMRQARLLRLMKVEGNMRVFFDAFNSEKTATIAKMAALMFFVVMVTHFVACGWYGLTKFEDADTPTWVKYHLEQDGQKPEWYYLYSTSLHWSITQFTPAAMEVYPHNMTERVANIIVVFFALVVFTSLVSSVTSTMTYLNNLNSEETSNKMKLRHWLSENSVSMNLVSRVWAAVRLSLKNKSYRMPMKEVNLLAELPKNVMAEVQEEVFKPVIADHPFFLRYLNRNRAGMRRIFNCTVGELSLDLGEELFAEGDPADRMFFVRSGTLYYEITRQESETVLRMPHRASYILRNRERRGQSDWCSEVALWAHWTYRGALTAASAVELLTIEGNSFRTVMTGFVKTDGVLSTYANEFAEAAYEHWRILDIWCDKEVSEEMSWKAFQQCNSWEDEDSDGEFGESEAESLFSPSEAVNPWSPIMRRQDGSWEKDRSATQGVVARTTTRLFG